MPSVKKDMFLSDAAASEKAFRNQSKSSLDPKSIITTLPLELWRVVFSYLSIRDLCRCSQTCKDWNELVLSLDSTRWRELFLQQKFAKRWKHPNWPNSTHIDPKSWRSTYKIHSMAAQQWLQTSVDASCTFYGGMLGLFRGPRQRKILNVGPGRKYFTINRALSAARPFDRIVLDPCHYQQFPLALKFPVEIVGTGDPNKVLITMLIEHTASSARIANVMLKPSYPRQRGRGASSSVLIKLGWSFPCDIWSIGCIMFELYTGNTLFQTHDNREHLAMMEATFGPIPQEMVARTKKVKYFRKGRLDWSQSSPDGIYVKDNCKSLREHASSKSETDCLFIDLLEKLLDYDPSKRLTAKDALKHPYFSEMRHRENRTSHSRGSHSQEQSREA